MDSHIYLFILKKNIMTNFIKKKTLLMLTAGSILMFSCNKKSSTTTDTLKPVITVAEPIANDTTSLTLEPEVHIEFTVTDDAGLHHLSVLLIKNNSDTIMNETPSVLDLKVYSFHEHYMPIGISSLTGLKVIIKADDHSGNTETKVIDFYVEP
jgi:hypothetical protein